MFYAHGDTLNLRTFGKKIDDYCLSKINDESGLSNAAISSDIPINQEFKNTGSSPDASVKIKKNRVFMFGLSSEETDAGQNFVPYFDGSDVADGRVPLSGIGLLHFSSDFKIFSGYIKPYLITLNLHSYVFNQSLCEAKREYAAVAAIQKDVIKSSGTTLKFFGREKNIVIKIVLSFFILFTFYFGS